MVITISKLVPDSADTISLGGGVSPPSPSRLSSLTRILAGIHTDRPTHFAINRHSPCARLPFPNQSTTPRPFSPRDDQLRRFSGPATTVSTPGHLGGSTSRCVASRHLQVGGEVMCGAGNEGHEIWRELLDDLEAKVWNVSRQAREASVWKRSSTLVEAAKIGNLGFSMQAILWTRKMSYLPPPSTSSKTMASLPCVKGHEAVVFIILESGTAVDARDTVCVSPPLPPSSHHLSQGYGWNPLNTSLTIPGSTVFIIIVGHFSASRRFASRHMNQMFFSLHSSRS
jgi:hypothetical protein